ncbi:MAG: hypothetical protein AABY07_04150 [Nanoarchaeota archaeon]
MGWFRDLQTKKEVAIKALPITIESVGYTDALDYPRYHNFKFDMMSEWETQNWKGLIFPSQDYNPDTSILIPLNDTDLVLVTLSPTYLYKDPIVKTIINSVTK